MSYDRDKRQFFFCTGINTYIFMIKQPQSLPLYTENLLLPIDFVKMLSPPTYKKIVLQEEIDEISVLISEAAKGKRGKKAEVGGWKIYQKLIEIYNSSDSIELK